MARLVLIRILNGWTEADDPSKALARRFTVGETYKADVVRPRNMKHLSRYWVLVQMILDNSEMFKGKEQVHNYLKVRAGHCTPIVAKGTGEVFLIPDSIDFDHLDEDDWSELWPKIVTVVLEDILPGITELEINTEIQRLCGLAR